MKRVPRLLLKDTSVVSIHLRARRLAHASRSKRIRLKRLLRRQCGESSHGNLASPRHKRLLVYLSKEECWSLHISIGFVRISSATYRFSSGDVLLVEEVLSPGSFLLKHERERGRTELKPCQSPPTTCRLDSG